MNPEKLAQKLESLQERLENLDLDTDDPNYSEFCTLKADCILLFHEMETLASNSAELEASEPEPQEED